MSTFISNYQTFIDSKDISIQDIPENPLNNQLWFDKNSDFLKKYDEEKNEWKIVNDYINNLNKINDKNINLLSNTSSCKELICSNEDILTGCEYYFINSISYFNNIKNIEMTLSFEWEFYGNDLPSGELKVKTQKNQYIQIGDSIKLSNDNYYGLFTYTFTLNSEINTYGICIEANNVNGTIKIIHPRLSYGNKDLGWSLASEDVLTEFITLVDKSNKGVYISSVDLENNTKSLVDINSKSIILKSDNIDLQGYVTFHSLSDPYSETIINGNLIETGTLKADQINSGTLKGTNSKSFFDLDNGTFKLGNDEETFLYFDGNSLMFTDKEISYKIDENSFVDNLSWIKSWTQNSTIINGKQILSPKAFFGTVDQNNKPTGISIGSTLKEIYEADSDYGLIDAGICGYLCGDQTFNFNANGSLTIGKENDRQIKIEDGILKISQILGEEISAYNLNLYKRKKESDKYTYDKYKSLSIDDLGNIELTPTNFYLYNGDQKAISLENGKVDIDANSITINKLSTERIDITDGHFEVKNGDNAVFKINEDKTIFITPTEFHLRDEHSEEDGISLKDGELKINANYIKSGMIDGNLIEADSINVNHLASGIGETDISQLANIKNFIYTKKIRDKEEEEIGYALCDKVNYSNYVQENSRINPQNINDSKEETYIQIDFLNIYKISTCILYIDNTNDIGLYYKLKYSCDNTNWYYVAGTSEVWNLSNSSHDSAISPYIINLSIDENGLKSNYINARYLRLYIAGNNSKNVNACNYFKLYSMIIKSSGYSTVIDMNGITTGYLEANKIKANSITSNHINIDSNGFSFNEKSDDNNSNVIFSIKKIYAQDENNNIIEKNTVYIQPDEFILKGKSNDKDTSIILKNGELNINASAITSGIINADMIKAGKLDINNLITSEQISSTKLNTNDFTVYGPINYNTNTRSKVFVIKNGRIYANTESFIFCNGVNIDELEGSDLDNKINEVEEERKKYIRFSGDTIELGLKENSNNSIPFSAQLNSTQLQFRERNSVIAWFSNSKLYVQNSEIKNILTIGRNGDFYNWQYRPNRHLSLGWSNTAL